MKKVVEGVILGLCIFMGVSSPVYANSLSNMKPSEEFPQDIVEYSEIIGQLFGICPELLQSIAYYESRFDSDAQYGNCIGLCQINPTLHEEKFIANGWAAADATNPYINMYVCAEILTELFEEYEDPAEVLMRYNGAKTALKEYHKNGSLNQYTQDVLTMSERLERAQGK